MMEGFRKVKYDKVKLSPTLVFFQADEIPNKSQKPPTIARRDDDPGNLQGEIKQ